MRAQRAARAQNLAAQRDGELFEYQQGMPVLPPEMRSIMSQVPIETRRAMFEEVMASAPPNLPAELADIFREQFQL